MVFDPVLNLADLNGSNGFRIDGVAAGDSSGRSVSSAGDINNDGVDDLIIGAYRADPNGSNSGSSYLVFGRSSGFGSSLALSSLNGINGFRIDGVATNDLSGRSVSSAGDVNGDGVNDLIIGAVGADPNGDQSGVSYVVFGRRGGFSSSLALSNLNGINGINGINGFRIDGVARGDFAGISVSSAGDINGDGFDDLIIGAERTDLSGVDSGSSYVVFGRSSGFGSSLALSSLDGSNGFRIDGVAAGDFSGASVSSAGDVNGDGFDDLIIGAYRAGPNGSRSGSSYVVFGRGDGFSSSLALSSLDGSNGFRINGTNPDALFGISVSSAGDINGDGFDDLIIGATGATPRGDRSGSSYVVFGREGGFSSTLNLSTLDGSNGFRIDGAAAFDFSGRSVSNAGDINGDGVDDLIIGAPGADPNGESSGSSYVVFGRRGGFSSILALSSLDGSNGFRIDGVAASDFSGYSVSNAGDINGDGVDDLIIGARNADPNGSFSGSSYVVFGRGTNQAQAPAIVTNGAITVPENSTLVVDIQSTDNSNSEGNGLTYSLSGGEDQGLFTIDATTGVLSFLSAPDFENPLDVGNDNGYAIEVTVTDAGGLSTSQLFNITVTDVNEAPINAPTPFDDTLQGTAGDDTIRALAGNDVVLGLGGDDRLFGQAGDDRLFGQAGDDRLIGGAGDDRLDGGDGNNILQGGRGRDILLGGRGNDRLNGGPGNDVITTGAGRDIIVIRQNDGFDRVTDFQNNRDRINLVGIQSGQLTILQRQDDVLIKLGNTNLLLLENTNASAIDRADFV